MLLAGAPTGTISTHAIARSSCMLCCGTIATPLRSDAPTGSLCRRLSWSHACRGSLAEYQVDISLEDYPSKNVPFPGRCYEVLRMLVPQEARAFLERAGDLRLQRRMGRWAQRAHRGRVTASHV